MKWKFAAAISIAVLAGFACAQLICQSIDVRDAFGHLCGRGHLVALAHGDGIYEIDVDRALAELRYQSGQEEADGKKTSQSREFVLSQLTTNAAVARLATDEKIPTSEIERQLSLLQFQFRDRKTYLTALRVSNLSESMLRRTVSGNLRARQWISRRLSPQLHVTTDESMHFYQGHRQDYFQPVRLRVSHLFLAAPTETAPEIVDIKKAKIEALAKRISEGGDFAEIVAIESEDEATKGRGGDLGFFSAYRMPPDFFTAAERLRPGEMSKPLRTALGFHIIQATDVKPAKQMTFEGVSEDIGNSLEHEKRRMAMRRLEVDLNSKVRIIRSIF
ncbi:MAG: hypothetical protein QOE73_197 [Verrucomicrobiota bacterium]